MRIFNTGQMENGGTLEVLRNNSLVFILCSTVGLKRLPCLV